MRNSLVFLFGLLSVLVFAKAEGHAQGTAPQFGCVRGDTLTWIDPVDACGALISVTINAAPTTAGPYSQLAVVPAGLQEYALNPAELSANAAFFLTATYACTPPASLPSDTILVPELPLPEPRIRTIDYTTAGTTLTWDAPSDPRVTRYIIYRETDLGTTILDTVTGTSYTELLTQVENRGAIYYLAPLDDCDATSFNPNTYSSATLVGTRDACRAEVTLARQLPSPWPHPFVSAFVSRISQRGVTDTIFLDRADSLLTVPDLPPDSAYTLRVTYIDDEGGSTTSFPISFGAENVVAEDAIEIAQVSFDGLEWQMRWRWKVQAQYTNITWAISGTNLSGSVDEAEAAVPIPTTSLGLGADFDWTGRTITLRATDACQVERVSLPATPAIVLAQELNSFAVQVNWQLPDLRVGTTTQWDLRFFEPGGSRLLLTSDTLLRFTHDVSQVNVREVCYQLVAEVVLPDTFGRGEQSFTWRSAPGCTLRQPRVFLPTGFVPDGFSIGYRPKMSLIEGLSYRFSIYDRWGKRLFETSDPFEVWEGRVDGRPVAAGVYLALVELDEPGRSPIRREAMVTLVR